MVLSTILIIRGWGERGGMKMSLIDIGVSGIYKYSAGSWKKVIPTEKKIIIILFTLLEKKWYCRSYIDVILMLWGGEDKKNRVIFFF